MRRRKLGIDVQKLQRNVYEVCGEYDILTLRQLYYRLISLHEEYPNSIVFYKFLSRWTTKWRKSDEWLDNRFTDPSRPLIVPDRSWQHSELWPEKDSLRPLLEKLAYHFRTRLVVQRGFPSRTLIRDALARARERSVKRIYLLIDHDPSGLSIRSVDERELGLEVIQVALTLDQARGLAHKPVNLRDTRARKYLAKHGNKVWELEALEPKRLVSIVERALRREVPPTYIHDARLHDEALQLVHDLIGPFIKKLRASAFELLKKRLPATKVKSQLAEKFRSLVAGS